MADPVQRRLAAILAADVAGYSRLMGEDEEGTLATLTTHLKELIEPCISEHRGRVVKTTGDGLLAEFASVVNAVRCAVAFQEGMRERNADTSEDRCIEFRIGVNLGDVIVQDDDVFGDGVNIASRLEGLAEPGGLCLSEDVYRQVRGKVDCDFEDLGPKEVKNIAEPVRAYRVSLDGATAPGPAGAPSLQSTPPLLDKPSIAVLPFVNMSDDSEQEYFADGIAEDIITTLSKLSGLFVIARNSSFAFKGQSKDSRNVATALGVRYILEGSVRKAGRRVRISTQLVDTTDLGHLWAERYDRDIDDVFAIQDEITLRIATELQVRLTEGEQARIHYNTTSNVEAWNNWIQGLAYYRRDVSKEGVGRAREYWRKALALDPRSATLNAMLGLIHWASARFGWWDDRKTELARVEEYVETALAIDDENADAHYVRALLLLVNGRHDEAVAEAWRAIDLGPGSADIAAFASLVFNFSGLSREALAQIEKAMRLSPIYPSWYLGDLGFANRLLGRHEEAISAFQEYGRRSAGFGHVDLVILYHDLGRDEDADVLNFHVGRVLDAESLGAARLEIGLDDLVERLGAGAELLVARNDGEAPGETHREVARPEVGHQRTGFECPTRLRPGRQVLGRHLDLDIESDAPVLGEGLHHLLERHLALGAQKRRGRALDRTGLGQGREFVGDGRAFGHGERLALGQLVEQRPASVERALDAGVALVHAVAHQRLGGELVVASGDVVAQVGP